MIGQWSAEALRVLFTGYEPIQNPVHSYKPLPAGIAGRGLQRGAHTVIPHRPAELVHFQEALRAATSNNSSIHCTPAQLSHPARAGTPNMASTPMDLDDAPSVTGTTSLNITRTLGSNVPSTTGVSDVIASFRPTKVCAVLLILSSLTSF